MVNTDEYRAVVKQALASNGNRRYDQQNSVVSGIDQLAPIVSWDDFLDVFDWKQHEHMAMIGPTGGGKTTLALQLLSQRDFVCALGTKPRDPVLDLLHKEQGYRKMKTWKDYDPELVPRRLLWPDATDLYSMFRQQKEFRKAMYSIYHQGGWCIYIDELWYIIHHLKLELEVRTFLQQARALHIPLVALTQRPAYIPLEVYDQSTHLFFWLDNDEHNLKRISGISYRSAKLVREIVSTLEQHQVLYVNTRSGKMHRTTPPPPELKAT